MKGPFTLEAVLAVKQRTSVHDRPRKLGGGSATGDHLRASSAANGQKGVIRKPSVNGSRRV